MIEFVKNIKPSFDLSTFEFKINKLKLDNKKHPENRAIKGLDRVASTQNKVWDEDMPKEIRKYINKFDIKEGEYHVNMNIQRPGQMAPLHTDNHSEAVKKFNISSNNFKRMLIFLTDWEMGQGFGINDDCITKWKAGDCYTFDETDYHWSANAGEDTKYTLVISTKK
jgi:hypothetical protein|tara:strand:+ start:404 stop:904 length:501 start_codon:yes stop_codon:yes gene_type:complete